MVGLSLEIECEIVVIAFQLIFDLLLLVGQAFNAHSLDVLLEFNFPVGLHEGLIKPQFAESLFPPLVSLMFLPLLYGLVARRFGSLTLVT